MINYIKILGFLAATLTTVSFLPQAIRAWKTRSTNDLSPLMFSMFFLGVIGWLFYGILINDLPMILANIVTIVLAGTIMYFIIKGKKSNKLEHLGIFVDDIDKVTHFYEKWFDAQVGSLYKNKLKKFSSRFITLGSGARIELMHTENSKVSRTSNMHLAISVGTKASVDRLAAEMTNSGIAVINGPRTTGDGYYECLVEDPEGNRVEITI